jgi:hypothetical protein
MKSLSVATLFMISLYSTASLALDAKLIGVEYYKGGPESKTGCTDKENYILVRQVFDVSGAEPKDLIFAQSNSAEGFNEFPVKWTNKAGHIVHGYCATPDHKKEMNNHFINSKNGEKSNTLPYTINCSSAEVMEGEPEELVKLK